MSISSAKTTKKEALAALVGERHGSFLLRVLDAHYMSVSVVCHNDVNHFLIRTIQDEGFLVEEPAQSVVHPTLLETLRSLKAPLYQLIREVRSPDNQKQKAKSTATAESSPDTPTEGVHSHFQLTADQLHSLNTVVKRWKGGVSRIVHVPFQAILDDQPHNDETSSSNNSNGTEPTTLSALSTPTKMKPTLSNQSISGSETPSDATVLDTAETPKAGEAVVEHTQADKQELLDKLQQHVRTVTFFECLPA